MIPEDHSIREDALLSEVSLAVTAGAGTGKTTLLIDKVLSQLLVRGVDVRRILMMTFTEKAANEMRIRLEEELSNVDVDRWEGRGASDVLVRAEKARNDLDRAEIGTIHSFCAHVLREYPIEAGLDPRFQVDEGARFDEIFLREWDRWLESELALDSSRGEEWKAVLRKVELSEMEAAARALSSFHIPLESLSRHGGSKFFKKICTETIQELEQWASEGPTKSKLTVQLLELAHFLQTGEGDFALKPSTATKGWGAGVDQAKAAVKKAIPLALARKNSDEGGIKSVLSLLTRFARHFRNLYTREGWVSFDGLLMQVRDLLRSRDFPGIRKDLQARYDFILVDEFQDTDPVQCEIVLFLSEEGGPIEDAAKVQLKPGKLFIVGDPKQSIYSFRGADIVAYDQLKDQILQQGGKPVVLRSNFRSQERILDSVNQIFSRMIVENGRLQPPYEEIIAVHPEGPPVKLLLFENSEGDLKSDESRVAEAREMARWILDSKVAYRDVAILLKALTNVPILLEELRAADIPYVVEGEKHFYALQEIVEFVNLLQAIVCPDDLIAVAGVLRSAFGGLDDRTLYEIRNDLDYRKEPPLPQVEDIWAMLRESREKSLWMTPFEFLDDLFEQTFVLENAASGFQGEQAVANLLKLRESARDFEAQEGGGVAGFVRRLHTAVKDMEDEGESPLADETLNAVKILSIHKSKGLEFPVVLLPDLHRMTRGGGDPPAVRFDWPTKALGFRFSELGDPVEAALERLEKERQEEEQKRLLYVAMTRAKEQLILLGSGNYKRNSWLGLLEEAGAHDVLEVESKVVSGETPRKKKRSGAGKDPMADWKRFAQTWRKREQQNDLPPMTSVTAMKKELSSSPKQGASRGAEIGIACHEALEHLDFESPKLPPMEAEAREIVENFLSSDGFGELKSAEILGRELPFLVGEGTQVAQGFIDILYRSGEDIFIGDYKTDVQVHPEEYQLTRDVYTRAVEGALGVKVAGFRLFYLRHGKVVTL